MISNQILQTTVDGLKAISRVDFCVIDADGKVAAKTFEDAQTALQMRLHLWTLRQKAR